jgi:hypothetical protein
MSAVSVLHTCYFLNIQLPNNTKIHNTLLMLLLLLLLLLQKML